MYFWILGQVGIECGACAVQFRSGMQTTLLATLLAAEGQIVSVGALAEELWGDDQPDGVENALQAHGSRLRRKFQMVEPHRDRPRLISQTGGYRLDLTDARVDAMVFCDEITAVRADPGMPPEEVIRRLRGALSLWRGAVFGGASVGVAAQAAAARLNATRLSVLELLFDTELKVGQHSTIIPELTALVRAESLNERLCELLMVALYRSGRQTDALSVYQRLRNRMVEDLGVDPSPMLRSYERAILSHDPKLLIREDHRRLRVGTA
jgi:DNA-binding SARP family transcriptional activator